MPPRRGAIFDWDGVIIDSHDQHEGSWAMLFAEEGRHMPEGFFKKSFGMRNETIIPTFFDWIDPEDAGEIDRLGNRKEELYRELVRRDGIEPLPGVVELLAALAEAGIPCCVGSSTQRKNVDTIMDVIGLGDCFADIAAAEDVSNGKPDPEVFLVAAAKIEREPEHCVVFEDAHVGIEAGLRAGMRVVAVATTHPAETLGDAHWVFEDLTAVNVAEVFSG